jgi:hypothetical protein
MEASWIILSFTGVIVLVVMIFAFRQNNKDRKIYEQDLKRPSNLYDDQSEANDIQ